MDLKEGISRAPYCICSNGGRVPRPPPLGTLGCRGGGVSGHWPLRATYLKGYSCPSASSSHSRLKQ